MLLQQCNALEIREPFDYNSDIVDCNVGIPGYVSYDPADPTVQAAASVSSQLPFHLQPCVYSTTGRQ